MRLRSVCRSEDLRRLTRTLSAGTTATHSRRRGRTPLAPQRASSAGSRRRNSFGSAQQEPRRRREFFAGNLDGRRGRFRRDHRVSQA